MKIIYFLLTLFIITQITYGQIETKSFLKKNAFEDIEILKKNVKAEKIRKMPPFNIDSILVKDKLNTDEDVPFRFGKGFDVNITLSEGTWIDVEGGRLWSLEIESSGAYSINFIFKKLYLPEGAYLYIGNIEETMLYGPVTNKESGNEGHFLTDLIEGDKVTLYLFEPMNKIGLSNITISRVIHGYINLFTSDSYGNFGGSWECNNDVVCFSDWNTESDAVALVLLSTGEEWCSGSLLMSTSLTFKPYFLTAFHCIDSDQNGELSEQEISSSQSWLFKFQYKKKFCGGNAATTGITYNSATFRSAWNLSDFALLEMNTSLQNDSRFTWLGWDRSGNNPTSGTGIHHPAGDVMKISFDNHNITPNTQTINWGNNISPINSHWTVGYDNGTTQGGSSGSPLFNEDKRVVGQLHGGISSCAPVTKRYGRFNISWTGGGTDATRLSNWLDPLNSGQLSTNTSKFPILSGSSVICSQNTYTIDNFPSGATATWEVYPENIVSKQENGSSVVLTKISSGTITLTATINDSLTLSKTISVSPISAIGLGSYSNLEMLDDWGVYFKILPSGTEWTYRGNLTVSAGSNNTYTWSQVSSYPNDIKWTANGANIDVYTRYANKTIVLKCVANSDCNSSTKNYTFTTSNLIIEALSLYPNPASNEVSISISEEDNTEVLSFSSNLSNTLDKTYTIQLWNSTSLIKSVKTNNPKHTLSLNGVSAGLYYIHVISGDKIYRKQLIVQ